MALSGSFGFSPTVATVIDEAFEHCLIDPATLTARHVTSAVRSMSLLMGRMMNMGDVLPWKLSTISLTLTASDADFTAQTGVYDILDAYIRRDGLDIPCTRIGLDEYEALPDKDLEGRPDRFWVKHVLAAAPTVTLWPVPENSTDVFRYQAMSFLEEPGALSNTVDIPQSWLMAFSRRLAGEIAGKFAPALKGGLIAEGEALLEEAKDGMRERSVITVRPARRRYRGRR